MILIYTLQLGRQFKRMAEELNRQFQSVSSDTPVSGSEGSDITWIRQPAFSLRPWVVKTGSFSRVNTRLQAVYEEDVKPFQLKLDFKRKLRRV